MRDWTAKHIIESGKTTTSVPRLLNITLVPLIVLFCDFVSCPVFVPFQCNRRVNRSNRRINFSP